ncbi:MAG: YjbQ family protein [Anaerolineales bacterium]|nr:MAG: YjbQ family protein [Anaerolineales bacterium]
MHLHTGYIELETEGHADMHDLTLKVERVIEESQITQGLVTIFTPSSTSSVTTIEYESGALEDLRLALDELAPADRQYHHNLRWGDGNGHAHLRSALLKTSFAVPLIDGHMALGTWQQILFIDFDVRPRSRRIIVQILGE